MADAATTLAGIPQYQAILSALTAMSLTDYAFPKNHIMKDGATYDFVVIGSGAGGSTVSYRLSEDGTTTVALIECGGVPPIESRLAGLFTLLPKSQHDWNFTSTDDKYATQNLMNNVAELTSGRMLGGSSSLNHHIHVRGSEYDFNKWVETLNDSSWSYENMLKYMMKSENCLASDIVEAYPTYHGTDGPLRTTKVAHDYNANILDSYKEMGKNVVEDITANVTLGFTQPLVFIGDNYRQSAAEAYLGQAKDRTNLYVTINSCVTKINFDSDNTATGVQVTTADGNTITINAKKEVIVSGGVFNSPKLLMLSGIGPQSVLEELDIKVLADLPVGQGLTDHHAAMSAYTLDDSTETLISDPHKFPAPVTVGNGALNNDQNYPDYQTINLVFPPGSSGLQQVCTWVFRYESEICQAIYDANKEKNVFFLAKYLVHPLSRGQVLISSTDYTVPPTIELGLYTNETDLDTMAGCLADFATIVNTTYFKSVNSTMVDLNLQNCKDYEANSLEFWKCYALEMSSTTWHYSGTCAMGSVLESNLKVIGFNNLRVVDASSMPHTIGGNIISAVHALAEKAADLIKEEWNLSC